MCCKKTEYTINSSRILKDFLKQMHQPRSFLLHRLLLISVLVSLLPPSSCDDEEYMRTGYRDCSKRSFLCGNFTINVSYPFFENPEKSYCGHPEFELTCNFSESAITIHVGEDHYRVVGDINYSKHQLTIADESFFSESCYRPSPYFHNDSQLNYSIDLNVLVYFWNCSSSVPQLSKAPCLSYDNLFYSLNSYPVIPIPSCRFIGGIWMVRTAQELMKDSYDKALQEGFIVGWTSEVWQDCGKCMSDDGVCGSDNFTHASLCFFPNGTVTRSSSRDGDIAGSSKHIGLIAGVCAGGVVLIAACFVALFFYRRRKRARRQPSVLLSQITTSFESSNSKKDPEFLSAEDPNTQLFQYEELHEATDGFSPANEIGDGGFGTVYRGNLADGRTVAIKRLYENNYRRAEQFRTEVRILSTIRHPNLVTLYGCTSRHSRELLLVFEYVPKGTVADHLHGSRAGADGLPWTTRMRIAVETAEALSYLHAVTPQIIHRDVKTNNILLDNHCHVKVADFGLSRLFPLDATHVSTLPQGTPGYLDPEYHQCYQLTDKSDVYSFGVVLVELISSKPAVDITRPRHEINLARLAIDKIQCDQMDQLVDPNLWRQGNSEVIWMVNRVAEVAFQCLQADREMRPTMREVADALRRIEEEARSRTKGAKDHGMAKDDDRLLNDATPQSPDTVIAKWDSRKTTSHTSV